LDQLQAIFRPWCMTQPQQVHNKSTTNRISGVWDLTHI